MSIESFSPAIRHPWLLLYNTHMNIFFSRELGDKCLEVSRCLAEMSVIKQELIDKTNLLHASQEMIDKMRLDAEKMRKEFNQFDEQIANTKYQTEVMRLQSNYLVSKSVKLLVNISFDGEFILR